MTFETLVPVLLSILSQEPRGAQEAPEAVHLPEEGAQVELLDHGGRPMVQLRIGTEELRVLVDTGSTLALALSLDACERLALEPEGEVDLGGPQPSSRFVVPEARVGDAVFEGLPLVEAGFVGGLPGVDGVLGFPTFEACLLTLDFPGRVLRLEEGTLEEGPNTVPFRRDEVMGFGMTVDVEVAGTPVPAHVDTGSPDVALFSNVAREGMPLRGEPRLLGRARTPMGDADITEALLEGALRLGPIRFDEPLVRFANLPQIAGRRLGNLGSAFFRGASITIDQRSGRMRIEPREGAAEARSPAGPRRIEPAPGERRRLGVQLAGRRGGDGVTRFSVSTVVPGSEAERAGLRVGDELVEVDGGEATQERLAAALAGTAPIRLTALREGERVALVLFEQGGSDG